MLLNGGKIDYSSTNHQPKIRSSNMSNKANHKVSVLQPNFNKNTKLKVLENKVRFLMNKRN